MTITGIDVTAAIRRGELDGALDGLSDAIRARRKAQASKKAFAFTVGDRVRFNNSTKPLYMRSAFGTITKINQATCTVDLDHPAGRFYKNIRTPYRLVEAV